MDPNSLLRGSTREATRRPRPLTTYGDLGDQVTSDHQMVTRQQQEAKMTEISPDHSVKSAHAEKEVKYLLVM